MEEEGSAVGYMKEKPTASTVINLKPLGMGQRG